jgi:hypothetical protein
VNLFLNGEAGAAMQGMMHQTAHAYVVMPNPEHHNNEQVEREIRIGSACLCMERLSLWRIRKVIVKSLGKLLRLGDQKSAKKKDARVLWYLLASKTLEPRLEFSRL